jgi:hypothetical protein
VYYGVVIPKNKCIKKKGHAAFTTIDVDHDALADRNCAVKFSGNWWNNFEFVMSFISKMIFFFFLPIIPISGTRPATNPT